MKYTNSPEVMKEYLHDESKKNGSSDLIFFPESEDDIIKILKEYPHTPITVQGARTGLTAGCVPMSGLTINMERMNKILRCDTDDEGSITVQPGVALQALKQYLQGSGMFFPPDPTESTASLGGMISCNSSGARSFKYGAVRNYVLGLTVILAGGDKINIKRGAYYASNKKFSLQTDNNEIISGLLPNIDMPKVKKHTAGYYIISDMDFIDLFIGAEGTLGIITSAKLMLMPEYKYTFGAVIFLSHEDAALNLVKLIRGEATNLGNKYPEALEFFGKDAVAMLRNAQLSKTMLTEMELIPPDCCAIYIEYTTNSKSEMLNTFDYIYHSVIYINGNPKNTWAAINDSHMKNLKQFRHAVPELINMKISEIKKSHPDVTKLGTDMSVPNEKLDDVFQMYRKGLDSADLNSAVFGHIGDNHVHVNIIPSNMEEYLRGKVIFNQWAAKVIAMGGTISAEHGIGKLKTPLLKVLYTEEELCQMKQLKKCFDPEELLNRGNIIEY